MARVKELVEEKQLERKVGVRIGPLVKALDSLGDVDVVFLDHSHDDQDALGLLDRKGLMAAGGYVVASSVNESEALEAGNYLSWIRKMRHFRREQHSDWPGVEVYRRV